MSYCPAHLWDQADKCRQEEVAASHTVQFADRMVVGIVARKAAREEAAVRKVAEEAVVVRKVAAREGVAVRKAAAEGVAARKAAAEGAAARKVAREAVAEHMVAAEESVVHKLGMLEDIPVAVVVVENQIAVAEGFLVQVDSALLQNSCPFRS